MRLMKTFASLALVALVGFGIWSFVCVPTPREITRTAIGESFVRMHIYLTAHHQFPKSLTDLPKRDGYANQITDAWKNSLIYTIEDDSFITLKSLGKDGRLGGKRDNADIQTTYRTKNPDGTWCVDDELWIVTAKVVE